jgi:hypothetical protein
VYSVSVQSVVTAVRRVAMLISFAVSATIAFQARSLPTGVGETGSGVIVT